ncbi:MAG: hypothetical protein GY795_46090 [Desulfobacterales bacterium]|nr:hypothetical protein [Desulfobacterales bacterium]
MNGNPYQNKKDYRRFLNFGFLVIISGVLVLGAFVFPVYASGSVAILLTSDEEAYTRPAEVFMKEINMPVEIFNLHGDFKKHKKVMAEILSKKPSLIFASGAKAAYAAKVGTQSRQDIPVVFAKVLNWKKYKLRGQKNMAGVATLVAPGTQFANMTTVAPEVKRVGVIYSRTHSKEIIEDAKKAAMILGLELIAEPIARSKDMRRAYEKKLEGRIDALWIIADPVVYTPKNMDWLKRRSIRRKLVTVGQSENIVKLGVLLAVNADDSSIGSRAVSIAKRILVKKKKPKKIKVKAPIGTVTILNLNTAGKIGLKISQEIIDTINIVIKKK